MTTENAAILFTDMVDSTKLSQSLTPEAADDVRRGHISILRQAIAETGGREVKNLGDGVMVVFGSASAALACGVVMQQGVELDNRSHQHSVGLRVGMSGGEVIGEDNDFFGDPVVEAARLCAVCGSGQILAADVLRAMASRRNRHQCRPVGDLTLKGLPDPVPTVEVVWEPLGRADDGATVPLPSRLAVRPSVGVVGREHEMGVLAEAAKRVMQGDGREVVLVSGEAGLGKTTLVAEAARAAHDDGACVLFGHCEEDLGTPYQLFAEALGYFVTYAPEEDLLVHIEAHGSELSRLVPALASRAPDLPPSKATDTDTERYLLFAAVVGLLATVSADQPVVLVLDDLQWADKASLLLLRHLTAADPAMRVLVLGTYRDNELSHADALRDTLGVLRRQSGVTRIELGGLDDTGVMTFLEAAAGHNLDDDGVDLAHAVYRETDGNPFFVSEVLRHLTDTGAIYQDATGRWVTENSMGQMALPNSVREVIGGRVVRLGPVAGRVLATAAVIGRDFDLDVLARATKTDEDELLDILDAAAAVALVREMIDTGRYSFAHALIQPTLYEDMGPTRRARAHRQVAEALEELHGDRPGGRLGELARHWIAATQPIDLTKAISYSRRAGDAALAALAPADALHYYAQALDLHAQALDPDPVMGIDLAIGLGTAQRQTGDPAFRDTLLGASRRAAALGDTDRLVAAALANNRGIFSAAGVVDTDKVAMLETALSRLPAAHHDRALVLANLCQELTWDSSLQRRRDLAEEAVSIAHASHDDATVVRVLNHISYPLRVPSLLGQNLAWTADALHRAERLGDPVLLFWAASRRNPIVTGAAQVDELDQCLAIAGSSAAQLHQPTLHWMDTFQRAARALMSGETDRGEQLAREALRVGTDSGQPDAMFICSTQLAAAWSQRGGSLDEVASIIEQRTAANPRATDSTAALASAYAEVDRADEARALLEAFATGGFDLPLDLMWLIGMVWYAEAAVECRVAEYAEPLLRRLAPWADQLSTNGLMTRGPVSHHLGGLAALLGRTDEADAYFTRSAAMSERVGATFDLARTNLLWGTMLVERGARRDVDRACDLLARAHAAAAAHGYGYVERRAAEALRGLD
ncbi:MAG: ATP-binding protein [Acidimicrobiales bacterium]